MRWGVVCGSGSCEAEESERNVARGEATAARFVRRDGGEGEGGEGRAGSARCAQQPGPEREWTHRLKRARSASREDDTRGASRSDDECWLRREGEVRRGASFSGSAKGVLGESSELRAAVCRPEPRAGRGGGEERRSWRRVRVSGGLAGARATLGASSGFSASRAPCASKVSTLDRLHAVGCRTGQVLVGGARRRSKSRSPGTSARTVPRSGRHSHLLRSLLLLFCLPRLRTLCHRASLAPPRRRRHRSACRRPFECAFAPHAASCTVPWTASLMLHSLAAALCVQSLLFCGTQRHYDRYCDFQLVCETV